MVERKLNPIQKTQKGQETLRQAVERGGKPEPEWPSMAEDNKNLQELLLQRERALEQFYANNPDGKATFEGAALLKAKKQAETLLLIRKYESQEWQKVLDKLVKTAPAVRADDPEKPEVSVLRFEDKKLGTWHVYLSKGEDGKWGEPKGHQRNTNDSLAGEKILIIPSAGEASWLVMETQVEVEVDGKKDLRPIRIVDATGDPKKILQKMQNAIEEVRDPGKAHSYDLSKDRSIAYLGFDGLGKSGGPGQVLEPQTKLLHAMPEMLVNAGYKMVGTEPRITQLAEDPANAVRKRIKEQYDLGVRDFYLNFSAHGTKDGILSSGDENGPKLTHKELEKIVKEEYPDCRFTINANSCFGGGLADFMKAFQDNKEYVDKEGKLKKVEAGRVAVFLQTKPDAINAGEDYTNALLAELDKMARHEKGAAAGYGEAHLRADMKAKSRTFDGRYHPFDPEVYFSQPGAKSTYTVQADRTHGVPDGIRAAYDFLAELPEKLRESLDQYNKSLATKPLGKDGIPQAANIPARSEGKQV